MSKKPFIIFGILIAFSIVGYFVYGAFATSNPHSWTNGLVGYWSFDGQYTTSTDGTKDVSGNGNYGQFNNGVRSVGGISGQALSFDGTDDYVDAGSGSSLNMTGDMTIEVWIYPKANAFYEIAGNGRDSNYGYRLLTLATGAVRFDTIQSGAAQNTLSDTSTIVPNQWIHIVAVRSGASAKIYKNGIDVTQTPGSHADPTTSIQPLRIGVYYDLAQGFFNGLIDEARLYSRALSADEVKQHYDQTRRNFDVNQPSGTPPVAWWKMDEGSDTAVYDATESNNDGSIRSSALRFDGGDDYVQMASRINFSGGSFSLEAWFRTDVLPSAGTHHQVIIGQVNDTGAANGDGWTLFLDKWTGGQIRSQFYDGVNIPINIYSNSIVSINTWYHVVVVFDNDANTYTMYLNGTAQTDTDTPTQSSDDTTNPLRIGTHPQSTTQGFDGIIDEVRIYSRALSSTEIAEHRSGRFFNESGLVLYIPFRNVSGGAATDYSSQGDNGTLNGYSSAEKAAGYGDTNGTGWVINTSWQAGKISQALQFGGANGFFQTNNYVASSTNFSHSLWFKSSDGTYSNSEYLFSQGDDDPSLYIGTNGKLNVMADNALQITSTRTVLDKNWHYLQITADGTNIYLYLDGTFEGSASYTGLSDANGFTAGAFVYRTNLFSGTIDDVRIYNYARTAEQILADYRAGAYRTIIAASNPHSWTNGLVGYWPFDGQYTTSTDGTRDVSNNGNWGAFSGGPKPAAGVSGQALSFDGTDDYVGADVKLISDYPFTITVWAKRAGGGSNIVWLGDKDVDDVFWELSAGTYFSATARNTTQYGCSGTAVINDNNWHFAAAVFVSAAQRKIYTDGVLNNTCTDSVAYSANVDRWNIGRRGRLTAEQYFNGLIDEVRIYSRALSADEILQHYQQTRRNLGI